MTARTSVLCYGNVNVVKDICRAKHSAYKIMFGLTDCQAFNFKNQILHCQIKTPSIPCSFARSYLLSGRSPLL